MSNIFEKVLSVDTRASFDKLNQYDEVVDRVLISSRNQVSDIDMLDDYYSKMEELLHSTVQLKPEQQSVCFCGSIAYNICEKCYADLCDQCVAESDCSNISQRIKEMER